MSTTELSRKLRKGFFPSVTPATVRLWLVYLLDLVTDYCICFSSRNCSVYEIWCTVGRCIWATEKCWINSEGVLDQSTRACQGNFRQCENLGSTARNKIPTQEQCVCVRWVNLWSRLHWVISRMLEMEKDSANCEPLLESTTSSLGEESMQMLLISTQRTNMTLCIEYAVKR